MKGFGNERICSILVIVLSCFIPILLAQEDDFFYSLKTVKLSNQGDYGTQLSSLETEAKQANSIKSLKFEVKDTERPKCTTNQPITLGPDFRLPSSSENGNIENQENETNDNEISNNENDDNENKALKNQSGHNDEPPPTPKEEDNFIDDEK